MAAGCYASTRRTGLRHVLSSMASPRRYTGEMRETVQTAMERAGVTHLAGELVDELPFGTQRRV